MARLKRAAPVARGKVVANADITTLLHAVISSHDVVCLEGDNQKQAAFLASALSRLDPARVSNLHMVMSCVTLPDHIALFRKGIARRLDFAYSGPQSAQMAQLIASGGIRVGAVHTYNELYGRYFVDLTPRVALVTAKAGDRHGNLFTGPNTEETPAIVEATAFHDGIVVAQFDELVDRVPRVDIPGDWVDLVVEAPNPAPVTPLFTRDPAALTEVHVLIAMLALRGIYERYEVASLNHGVGFNTAAVELLLPTYGEHLGLRGGICRRFMLNPHPTLIPAIEAGWVESVFGPGGEVGMERYTSARPDVYFCGPDGSLRSNRALAQLAGHFAVDMFIGSTLQVDVHGKLLHGHKGPHHRLRRGPEHGVPADGPAPSLRLVAQGRRRGRPRSRRHSGPQARGAAGGDVPVRRQPDLRRDPRRCRSGDRVGDGRDGAGHDLRRRRHPCRDRGRHREPVRLPGRHGTRRSDPGGRGVHTGRARRFGR